MSNMFFALFTLVPTQESFRLCEKKLPTLEHFEDLKVYVPIAVSHAFDHSRV